MRRLLLLVCLFALFITPTLAQDADVAHVRAAHFSTDAPEVDIFVNGEVAVSGMVFADLSDWMEVPADTYSIAVVPAGGSVSDAVLAQDFTLGADDWATIAVIGAVGNDSLALQPIIEDLSTIDANLTRVGLFHGVYSLAPVTVSDNTERDLVVGLGYPGTFEGSDGYTSVDVTPASYTFTISDEAGETLDEVGPTVLGAGRYYFYAAIGTAEAPAFIFDVTDVAAMMSGSDEAALTSDDTGTGELTIRVGHFASDAPPVDVYVDGAIAVANLSYTDMTDFLDMNGGVYEVALVPAGGDLSDAVYTDTVALFEDTLTLVAAIGLAGDGSLDIITVQEDGAAAGVGEGRVAFLQTIPTDALFNLTLDGNILVQGVSYPDVFEGAGDGYVSVDIVATDHSFGIEAPDAGIDIDTGSITMGVGRYYLFVAVGTADAPNYLLLPTDIPE